MGNFYLKKVLLTLFTFLLLAHNLSWSDDSLRTIRVGIYENKPLVFMDNDGKVKGFFIDILEYIATKERWHITYTHSSWQESLNLLSAGKIDILCCIAYSEDRNQKYDFNSETLIVNWGQVYTNKRSNINSFIDLKDKTVALLKGDIHATAFKQIIQRFDINVNFIYAKDYPSIFMLIGERKVDAAVTNHFFALQNESKYNVKSTPIIFNPIHIHFAAPKNTNQDLLKAIDEYVSKLKKDQDSLYYHSQKKWFGTKFVHIPINLLKWLIGAIIFILLLIILMNILLKIQVKDKTKQIEREVTKHKQTSKHLLSILEAAQNVAFVMVGHKDQQIVEFSPGAENIFNYKADEVIGKSIDFLHLRDEILKSQGDIEKTDKGYFSGESIINCKSGEKFPVLFTIYPVFDTSGAQAFTIYVFIDITDLKQTEHSLMESESKNSAILDAIPDLMFIQDKNGTYLDYHASNTDNLYISPEKFINKNVKDVLPKELAEKFTDMINEVMSTNKMQIYDYELPIANQLKYFEIRLVPYDHDKILSIVRDITARKLTEEALRESEENLRITLNSIGDGVIATDVEGRIIGMNPVAEKLTGYSQEETIGLLFSKIFNIVSEDTRKTIPNPINKVLEGNQIVGLANHTILISRDGKEYNIADAASPIRDANGITQGVVLVFRDITEKLKLQKNQIKLKQLESLGMLAGGIAHDFNNILTALFGNIELAKMETAKTHPAYSYLDIAHQALERATHLTRQLLTFAKGGNPILAAVNLKDILQATVTFNLSGSNIKPHFDLPNDLWQVKADKGQISQVIGNLTINAKQAMPDGGNLYISAANIKDIKDSIAPHLSGNFVKLTIKDEGIGIPEKYLEKIFNPYFTTKQQGNGLGLAVVYSIITKHNGHIYIESGNDEGTKVIIYLPSEESKAEPHKESIIAIQENTRPPSLNILVMDDESMIRNLGMRILESLGHKTDCAAEGEEAFNKYKEAKERGTPFDIVITDLTIPGGMGGEKLVKKLLAIDPDAKVIVSSGYSTNPILADYGEYGFKGRIIKPFSIKDLQEELDRVMKE